MKCANTHHWFDANTLTKFHKLDKTNSDRQKILRCRRQIIVGFLDKQQSQQKQWLERLTILSKNWRQMPPFALPPLGTV
jgi:hypothetical protein